MEWLDRRGTEGLSVVGGRYELGAEIGRGASGTIITALDRQLDRQVAVKLLHRSQIAHPEAIRQFELEAKAIAQLRSSHVVQVYDFGLEGEHPFIVMELLEGEGLDVRLQRRGRLPFHAVAKVVEQIAIGLACVHASLIIHRDLKPANVFLARESGHEVAKLLDFGVSKRAEPSANELSTDAIVLGTPRYMSPEHIMGQDPDPSADTWSLAVMAYQMLTGAAPFDGATLLSLRQRICAGVFEPPSTLVPDLAPAVDELFARALNKSRDARPRSAGEFASELLNLAHQQGDHVTRVLFVDDESDMELLLRQRFRHELREGTHELVFATNGESALDELRRRPDIDVVLTDLNMPGMNGLTFLSRVPEVNPFVRVVVVSAYGDMANIRAAMNAGAFDFVCKPIDFEDLDRTIRRCTSNVIQLRKSLASQEENGILRVLLGSGAVDRFVNVGRSGALGPPEYFEASVVCIGLPDPHSPNAQSAQARLAAIRAHFDMTIAEMSARQGSITLYTGDCVLVLFKGSDHVERALDASCCFAERMSVLQGRSLDARSHEARVGVAAGDIMFAAVGSRALGRLECVVLGEPVRRALLLQSAAAPFEVLMTGTREELRNGFGCFKSPSWPEDRPFAAFGAVKRGSPAPVREPGLEAASLTLTSAAEDARRAPISLKL